LPHLLVPGDRAQRSSSAIKTEASALIDHYNKSQTCCGCSVS
jgi:hypothetical protein